MGGFVDIGATMDGVSVVSHVVVAGCWMLGAGQAWPGDGPEVRCGRAASGRRATAGIIGLIETIPVLRPAH
ncbi:hypothetical protein AB0B63_13125 [Micromonospora sp. NPDC049081]|uniref:hypothetical protein n=1 Tax=Micromonospora sp. NPDC049081 TaxID=3155150 RepID=UPI0033EA5068